MRSVMIGMLLCVPPASATDDPKPASPGEQLQAILKDWQAFVAELRTVPAELKSDEARQRFYEESKEREHALYIRALKLAEGNPDDPAAVDALAWVVYQGQPPEREKALKRLTRDYIESPGLKPALSYISMRRHHILEDFDLYERLLREAMAKNPDREIRGLVYLRLGQFLRLRADAIRRLEQFPDYYGSLYRRYGLGPEGMGRLRERAPDDLAGEAERLFEQTIEGYADIADCFYPGRDDVSLGTLGDGARKELYEIRHLSIGKPAPEIEGEDIDGKPMRLSDYRGKVLVLVFWGTWCGPCMAMVPHEREMAERLEGKPFALLGVNSDEDREQAKEVMEREGITWRSWWDGGSQSGPIATQWNVDGWPTIYVLDSEGVIRYTDIRGEQLDEAVDTLLKEMEAKAAENL